MSAARVEPATNDLPQRFGSNRTCDKVVSHNGSPSERAGISDEVEKLAGRTAETIELCDTRHLASLERGHELGATDVFAVELVGDWCLRSFGVSGAVLSSGASQLAMCVGA
jgi:hypothetical protein